MVNGTPVPAIKFALIKFNCFTFALRRCLKYQLPAADFLLSSSSYQAIYESRIFMRGFERIKCETALIPFGDSEVGVSTMNFSSERKHVS